MSWDLQSANRAVAVTPNDSTELTLDGRGCRGLYVGVAGNISVVLQGDGTTPTLFTAVPAGSVLPVKARIVRATGTTATNLVALY